MTTMQIILVALFCMTVVFGVLIILWAVIRLHTYVIQWIEKNILISKK